MNDFTYAELEMALKTISPTMIPAMLRILLERADAEVFKPGGLDRFIQRVKQGQ